MKNRLESPGKGELMSELLQVTDKNFDEALKAPLAIIEFWAPWCPGCKAAKPTIAKIAGELQGQVLVVGADIDEAPKATERHEVTSIPTLVFFRDGKEFYRIDGTTPYRRLMPDIKSRFGI
jgi:thioredoxin 1